MIRGNLLYIPLKITKQIVWQSATHDSLFMHWTNLLFPTSIVKALQESLKATGASKEEMARTLLTAIGKETISSKFHH